ncbi:MAG: phosphoribosylformylglycinamidine synthase subunit PurS [Leptospiraceae bacterium]|nr:phosphoribosylformylglycinamidine synthase subunit PurS [Leptospiraceae bacterium]
MYLGKISITLKESVLDPQGSTVHKALSDIGETNVSDVRIGKYIEVSLNDSTEDEAMKTLHRICKSLLVNEVVESYKLQLEKK